jgi:hypothetical protein
MHLDEAVEPVAQKALVLSRGHAVEQLEELFLLLGGSRKHFLCLCMLSRQRFWPGGENEAGGARVSTYPE